MEAASRHQVGNLLNVKMRYADGGDWTYFSDIRPYIGHLFPEDPLAEYHWTLRAANGGSSDACYTIGVHYVYGLPEWGIAKDKDEALKWFSKVADCSDIHAPNRNLIRYDTGVSMANIYLERKNYAKAKSSVKYGSDHGDRDSMEMMQSILLDEGNDAEAEKYAQRIERKEERDRQFNERRAEYRSRQEDARLELQTSGRRRLGSDEPSDSHTIVSHRQTSQAQQDQGAASPSSAAGQNTLQQTPAQPRPTGAAADAPHSRQESTVSQPQSPKGQWVTATTTVTWAAQWVDNSSLGAVIVNARGEPDVNGGFIRLDHDGISKMPVYYSFQGKSGSLQPHQRVSIPLAAFAQFAGKGSEVILTAKYWSESGLK